MINETKRKITSNDVKVVEEINKIIDYIKTLQEDEKNEERLLELALLRFSLVEHKEKIPVQEQIHIDRCTWVTEMIMSKENLKILRDFGWTILECYDYDYSERTEFIRYMFVIPGGILPKLEDLDEKEINEEECYLSDFYGLWHELKEDLN